MPKTLLIIDDSISIHRLIRPLAELDQMEFHFAYDGESGLSDAARLKPDLILLDIEMPGIDGFEVCRRLKADSETAGIPVIFLSAGSGYATTWRSLDVGAMDFVAKPFKLAELRERIRSAMHPRQNPPDTRRAS